MPLSLALLLLAQEPRVEAFRFAVVSDPHVGARGSEEGFARFAEEANRLGVAFTIACGDLTEVGSRAEWERLASLAKALKAPFHPVLGNHDARWSAEGKRPLLERLGVAGPHRSFDHGGVRFALLDSSIVGSAHGGIDRSQLEWLDAALGSRPQGAPAVAVLHHPPLPGGGARYLANEEALVEVLRARGVALLLAGHGHSMRRWSAGGVEARMTSNLYAEKPRWRLIRVSEKGFEVEDRTVGEAKGVVEAEIPFRAPAVREDELPPPLPPLDEVLWRVPTPASALRGVAVAGEKAFLAGIEGRLAVHSLARGELLKTVLLDGPVHGSPIVAGERLILATEAGTVAAFRTADLSPLWEARLGSPAVMTPAADERRLYVGDSGGSLHALFLHDGSPTWSFEAGRHFGPPAAGADRVFAGNWDGHVYALAASDGRLLWKRKFHDSFYFAPGTSRPAIAGDLVVATSAVPTRPPDAPSVLALRAATGEVAWSARLSAGYASPLALDDLVLLSTTEGSAVALEAATGKIRWERPLGGAAFDASPIAVPGGAAFPTVEGDLVFFDLRGGERGRLRVARPWLFATPFLVGERLVLPDGFSRELLCLRAPR